MRVALWATIGAGCADEAGGRRARVRPIARQAQVRLHRPRDRQLLRRGSTLRRRGDERGLLPAQRLQLQVEPGPAVDGEPCSNQRGTRPVGVESRSSGSSPARGSGPSRLVIAPSHGTSTCISPSGLQQFQAARLSAGRSATAWRNVVGVVTETLPASSTLPSVAERVSSGSVTSAAARSSTRSARCARGRRVEPPAL